MYNCKNRRGGGDGGGWGWTSDWWFLQTAPTASQPMGCVTSSVCSRQKIEQLFPLDGEAKAKKKKKRFPAFFFLLFFKKRFPAMMGELSICPTNRRRQSHEREATSIEMSVWERHSICSDTQALPTSEWDLTESWLTTGQKVSGANETEKKKSCLSLYIENKREVFAPPVGSFGAKNFTSWLQFIVCTVTTTKIQI